MNFIKKHIFAIIIIIFHCIGLIGFIISPAQFTGLSYVNLMLSAGLVIYNSKQTYVKFYFALLAIALIGFIAEVIGVKTGMLFGNYSYGSAFGFKILDVPLMIGVNWAMLAYSTLQIVDFKSRFLNALSASALMLFLDFFIEQSAQIYDFWYWKGGQIPLTNYRDWFIVALMVTFLFEPMLKNKQNKVSKLYYWVQLPFFIILFCFSKLL